MRRSRAAQLYLKTLRSTLAFVSAITPHPALCIHSLLRRSEAEAKKRQWRKVVEGNVMTKPRSCLHNEVGTSSGGHGAAKSTQLPRALRGEEPAMALLVESGSVCRVQLPARSCDPDYASGKHRKRLAVVAWGALDDSAIMENLCFARSKVFNAVRMLTAREHADTVPEMPCEGCATVQRETAKIILPCGRLIVVCCPCAKLFGRMLTGRLAKLEPEPEAATSLASQSLVPKSRSQARATSRERESFLNLLHR